MVTRQERWQLAGTASEVYEQHLVPAIFGAWAPLVVEAASLRPGERVLDVACGTGVVAREAAARVGANGTVVGLDLNPGMLAVARALPPGSGAPVEWREGDAAALPFPDAAFDVALCQFGLQYVPDRPAALAEMRRVLVPGGRLALLIWRSIEESPGFALLAEALERHVGAPAAAIMRAPFDLAEPDEVRGLIAGTGFRDVDVQRVEGTVRFPSAERFVQVQVAGSPLAGPVGEASEAARAALIEEVMAVLRPYEGSQGLVFPIAAHLATGHA
jgi:SAM-dependent methyltransferase